MTILLIGAGDARDHATFLRLRSEGTEVRYALLGENALLRRCPEVQCVGSAADAAAWARSLCPDLVVVQRPELLLDGVPDRLRRDGHLVLGASTETAQLEGSKLFCKIFLQSHGVPTPDWIAPDDLPTAREEVKSGWQNGIREYVVKSDRYLSRADVRSAVPADLVEALECLDRLSGISERDRGPRMLLEQRMYGPELSLHVLLDGQTALLCPPVSDYKALHDGDLGPNTHGMGAVAAPWRPGLRERIASDIVRPVLAGLRADDLEFRGVLYLGVMLTEDGPQVLEINVRPGNPEWIALLALLKTPLADVLYAMARGTLCEQPPVWRQHMVSGVAFATVPGYPNEHAVCTTPVLLPDGVEVIGEGIRSNGSLMAGVGRSFCVVDTGSTVAEMRDGLYAALERATAGRLHFRTDIGHERPMVTGDLECP